MNNIENLMESAGISKNSTILIHSAFKKLSTRNIDPYTFVEQLVNYFDSDGTVLMPAMSWKICTSQNPYFDVRSTKGNVGILAEIFRKKYAKFRSIHPTHSVCGMGSKAKMILDHHNEVNTPCSKLSPFGKLVDYDGIILMIGVDLSACTLFHCAEEIIAKDVYLMEKPEKFICKDIKGVEKIVNTYRHKRIPRYYNKLKPLLEKSGVLRHGFYLGVEWISLKAKDSLLISQEILKNNPYYFYLK